MNAEKKIDLAVADSSSHSALRSAPIPLPASPASILTLSFFVHVLRLQLTLWLSLNLGSSLTSPVFPPSRPVFDSWIVITSAGKTRWPVEGTGGCRIEVIL